MKSLYGYRFRYSFFFKLIIPEIQHLRQHNGQKKCTIGESYNAPHMIAKLYLVADV